MAKDSNFNIAIKPEDVVYTNISVSKDGYNSARMVVKAAEKEYMSISYEWEGSGIPTFAMDMMGFMKTNKVETSGIWPGKETAMAELPKFIKLEEAQKGCGPGGKGKGPHGKDGDPEDMMDDEDMVDEEDMDEEEMDGEGKKGKKGGKKSC